MALFATELPERYLRGVATFPVRSDASQVPVGRSSGLMKMIGSARQLEALPELQYQAFESRELKAADER